MGTYDNEEVNKEIDAQTMTEEQESEWRQECQDIYYGQILPIARDMLDNQNRYSKLMQTENGEYYVGVGLEYEEAISSDKGAKAADKILAGEFITGGRMMREAFFDNAKENAAYYLGIDSDKLKEILEVVE